MMKVTYSPQHIFVFFSVVLFQFVIYQEVDFASHVLFYFRIR